MVERFGLGFLVRKMLAKGIIENDWHASYQGDLAGAYWWESDGNSGRMKRGLGGLEVKTNKNERFLSMQTLTYSIAGKPYRLLIRPKGTRRKSGACL